MLHFAFTMNIRWELLLEGSIVILAALKAGTSKHFEFYYADYIVRNMITEYVNLVIRHIGAQLLGHLIISTVLVLE